MYITCVVAWLLSNNPMQFLEIHLLPWHPLFPQKEALKEAVLGNTDLYADGF